MSVKEIVKDKLFMEMKRAEGTLDSCKACLANDEFDQAMVRLQELGVRFNEFECEIIFRSIEKQS